MQVLEKLVTNLKFITKTTNQVLINSKNIVIIVLAVALGVSAMMNFNEFQSQANTLEPEIQVIEPKIITTERGNEVHTGLEITTGKYPLEYHSTLKINNKETTSGSDTIDPYTKIDRGISRPLDSGEYLITLEYVADGTDNSGNTIHYVDTKHYNIAVP